MKKLVFFGFLLIVCGLFSYAALYADVTFIVSDTGNVNIKGNTNYQEYSGIHDELTSKINSTWSFDLKSPVLDNFNYKIELPKGSTIEHIKSNAAVKIEDVSGTLAISGSGTNKSIDISIQYTIDNTEIIFTATSIIIAILVVILIYLIFSKRNSNKQHSREQVKKKSKEESPKKEIDRKRFTERQLQIIDYLSKHGTSTQAELEKALNLPKSSLSRNIEALAKKEIIFKEAKGMSNVIGLK